MKKTLVLLAFAMASVMAFAAPAPYPVTVNSRALTAPPLIAYRGNECVYRVYFTDGDTPSSISNATPFLAWSTNNNAAINVTSSYSVVNVASGIVDFTFSPASLNYTPGRYVYEVGVYNGNARVYRQGIFTIVGSPVGQGVGSVTWSTNVSWAAVNWIGAPTITIGDQSGSIKTSLVFSAFGTWTSTNKVSMLFDVSQPSRYFTALENGTGTVYEIAGPYTNLTVTLSSDFLELDTNTRPAWTNNVFPFTDGNWLGFESSGSFYITHSGGAVWEQPGTSIPATLSAVNIAAGSASIVVSNVYYTTNAVRHFATEADLTQAKAECGAALTNMVIAATNALMPYTQTVYGDFTTTNETGYAAFAVANPASQTAVVAVPPLTGATNTYSFSYPVQPGRFISARCVAYANLGGSATVSRSVLSLFDGLGNLLTSNVFDAVDSGNDILPYFTNSVSLATAMTNGLVLRLAITVGKASSVAPHTLYTGGATPMSLSVNYVPTPYVTQSDLANYTTFAQVTNIAQSIGGGTATIVQPVRQSATNVVIAATNAVYYVALTEASNVGFDTSALALGGVGNASVTLFLDCQTTQSLSSVFNTNSVTFDMPWEPTVTGRYEIAVSFDGIRTTARQAWPKNDTAQFGYVKYNYAGTSSTFPNLSAIADGSTNGAVYTWVSCPNCMYAVRAQFSGGNAGDTVTFGYYRFVLGYADFISPFVAKTIINPGSPYGFSSGWVIVPSPTPTWLGGPGFANGVGLWVTRSSSTALVRCTVLEVRKANALEIKAVQAMGL